MLRGTARNYHGSVKQPIAEFSDWGISWYQSAFDTIALPNLFESNLGSGMTVEEVAHAAGS